MLCFSLVVSGLLPGLFFGCGEADAQVAESATGAPPHLWAGVEGSTFNPDYNKVGGRLDGVGFYGDYDLAHHLGVEAEIRLLDLKIVAGQTQKTFLIGPRINAYRYNKFTFYAKALGGVGLIDYPYATGTTVSIGYGSYFTFALGGGAEYQLRPRLKIRGEYEWEDYPTAPGFQGQPSNGLTPTGYSGGISYRIF